MNYEDYKKGYEAKNDMPPNLAEQLGISHHFRKMPVLSEEVFYRDFGFKPRLIGFGGLAGSGKSTMARFMKNDFGYTIHKFAEPIKQVLRGFGLSELEVNGELKDKPCELLGGKTPRFAMQTLGDWGRNLHPDFWVAKWLETLPKNASVVCDDVRFQNEINIIHSLEGITCYIESDIVEQDNHNSETSLSVDDFTLSFKNGEHVCLEKWAKYLHELNR